MSKKLLSFMIVFAVVISMVGFNTSYLKEQAHASAATLETTKWITKLEAALNTNSVKVGFIYVTNIKGAKVKAKIVILADKKTVQVSQLKQGNYVLVVKKSAFVNSSKIQKDKKVSFQVVNMLKPVATAKQLKDYFASVIRKNQYIEKNTLDTPEQNATPGATDNATGDGETSHSTTNNQVEGIEEGDMTVVNSRYIFSVKDQSVVVTDTKDPTNLKQVTTLTPVKNGYVQKVLLHQNLLLVVVDEYADPLPLSEGKIGYPRQMIMTKLFIYNVEDPANAEVVRIVGQEGYFNNIRKVGNTVYMILNHTPNYWIMQTEETPELRPMTYDSKVSDALVPMKYSDLSILPGTVDPQYSIIKAIDLSSDNVNAVTTKGFLGSSSGLYMSEKALYLTSYKYEQNVTQPTDTGLIWMPQAANTDIYKWNIDGLKMDFAGSATVKGTVLNQYSMDEYNGDFRIATTEGFAWDEKSPSKNHLFVLNDSLQMAGKINDLAPGERIYSARFMGEKAYLVTFKQVDPLFVIDVSNPANPNVLGELKIPGFSNYLHPLGENYLIGIGYDTETKQDPYSNQPRTVTTSMKLSLFDVTDIKQPKEQQSVLIGGKGSHSDAQYDPKAFFRYAEKGLYGFPVALYDAKNNQDYIYQGSGALIYHISQESGIQLKGNLVQPVSTDMSFEDWERNVQRIVYIGNTLFTISRAEVKSYNLDTFEPLGTIKIN